MSSRANGTIRLYWHEITGVKNSLFLFLASWTAMVLAMGWAVFFVPSLIIPDVAITSYLILLGVYILHKEFSRWTGVKMVARPGEIIVYIWWISLMIMVLISFLTKLQVPEALKFMSYDILGALLVSEISKSLNSYKIRNVLYGQKIKS